eukprot:43749-Pyramimonas_sp.AAC.1
MRLVPSPGICPLASCDWSPRRRPGTGGQGGGAFAGRVVDSTLRTGGQGGGAGQSGARGEAGGGGVRGGDHAESAPAGHGGKGVPRQDGGHRPGCGDEGKEFTP